jgi:serine protease Do
VPDSSSFPEPDFPTISLPATAERVSPASAASPRRAEPVSTGRRGLLSSLMWILSLLAFLLVLQYVVPFMLETYQYALTRGRQRAEYEAARDGMQDLSLVSLSKAYQLVSQRVAPSVVHINVVGVREPRLSNEIDQLFGPQQRDLVGQEGSGVIMDEAGHIVTNFHVVHGAARVQVSLSDGRLLPARLVGADAPTDLAVLQVDSDRLTPAEWGDSDELDVGALVWAAGSPFGLQSTITCGILSGKHRSEADILSAKHRSGAGSGIYQDFLQTDAAVNPGNSGGPLVDAHGRVVGINTAIVGDAYQGISFAIPSSIAKVVFERLKTKGRIARGWLGVHLQELKDEDLRRLGLPDKQGVLITLVIDDPQLPTPALEAGLRANDVVLRWNGKPISKPPELMRMVALSEIGSTATILVRRDGQELSLPVKVAERPPFRE